MSRPTSSVLPFSKACDLLGDAAALAPFYEQIDRCPDALAGQHPIRRWEYATALYTMQVWQENQGQGDGHPGTPLQICDVGGAGSNFWKVLAGLTSETVIVVDPSTVRVEDHQAVFLTASAEDYAANAPHDQFDVLTCISVIEHVRDLRPFFRACRMLLKPGGLLFLTTDYWDADGEDTAHFHWMRERIYNAGSIRSLLRSLRDLGYRSFGTSDWTYAGAQVYNYSVASLAVVKS